jgi:HlyD family secretion protein/adhesin transport system membrane fusion protein
MSEERSGSKPQETAARLGPLKVDARAARDASLKLPLLLETGKLPVGFAAAASLGAFALIGALAWSAIAEFNELAVAQGTLVPQGAVRVVEHLEGGIVEEIAVIEGQVVEADSVLMKLRPNVAGGEYSRLIEVRDAHRLRVAVLDALINDVPFAIDPALADHPAALNEASLWQARHDEYRQKRAALEAEIVTGRAQRAATEALLASFTTRERLLSEQLSMRQKLLERGFAAQSTILEFQNELEDVRGSLARAQGELAAQRQMEARAEAEREQLATTMRTQVLEERSQVTTEIAVAEAELARLGDRVDRLVVRAPIRGIVKSLAPRGQGEVVTPGETVVEIVPMTDTFQAELRLAPADAGHVRVGLPTQIAIAGFDRSRFGSLEGEVTHISASTFAAADAQPYYKVVVDVRASALAAGDVRHQLIPGMQVSGEIVTGTRSFLSYLLKPVARALENPFWER